MSKRTVCFTDIEAWGIHPDNFVEDDRPAGNVRQAIGQIFREHRDLLTKREWRVVELRYCMDKSVMATARELRIRRALCRALAASAFKKLLQYAKREGRKESR